MELYTAEELSMRRRDAFIGVGIAAAGFLLLLATALMNPDWLRGLGVMSILWFLASMFLWDGRWSAWIEMGKPLDGQECIRLQALVEEHPPIAEHIARVRAMGRPVVNADLWEADSWLEEQKRAMERRACAQLNGIGSA